METFHPVTLRMEGNVTLRTVMHFNAKKAVKIANIFAKDVIGGDSSNPKVWASTPFILIFPVPPIN